MAEKSKGAEVPAWMVTFADLMALMMTFFVLLYSFSTVDEKKYKMIAASMAEGFGSSVIRRTERANSAPGAPTFTPMRPSASRSSNRSAGERNADAAAELLAKLEETMKQEISEGKVAVETRGNSVIVRLPNEIAFPPGSDEIAPDIIPILATVAEALKKSPGRIMVGGHTDDRPISSTSVRSNWELSTDRAVSVIHELIALGGIKPERLAAVGYADTHPIVPNDTPEHRARNRRVEISIINDE